MPGTVQTLECRRDGRVCWSKSVYIPESEQQQAYAQFNAKSHGVFFYTFTGEIKSVSRKPVKIERWNT